MLARIKLEFYVAFSLYFLFFPFEGRRREKKKKRRLENERHFTHLNFERNNFFSADVKLTKIDIFT